MKNPNKLNNTIILIGPAFLLIFIFLMFSAEGQIDGGWGAMAIMYSLGPIVLIALIISLISFIIRLVKEKKSIASNLFVLFLLILFLLFIFKFIFALT